MPRPCSVCHHDARPAIDQALVLGSPLRDIAKQFGVGETAVERHRVHVAAQLAEAVPDRADDLHRQVHDLQRRLLVILAMAEEAGDLRAATAAIREARAGIELLARLAGELGEQRTEVRIKTGLERAMGELLDTAERVLPGDAYEALLNALVAAAPGETPQP